jgi:hypothetical protein
MAQIDLSFALEDQKAADSICAIINQAGFGVRSSIFGSPTDPDDRENSTEGHGRCTVVLWSEAAAQSVKKHMPDLVQAWSSDQLILVCLDHEPLPVGLRDLSAIPRSDAIDFQTKLIDRIKAALRRPEPVAFAKAATTRPRLRWMVAALCFGTLVAIAMLATTELIPTASPPIPTVSPPKATPNQIPSIGQPDQIPSIGQPDQFPDTDRPDRSEVHYATGLIALGLLLAGVVIGAGAAWLSFVAIRRRSKQKPVFTFVAEPQRSSTTDKALQIFISYSRKDANKVDLLVEQIERLGLTVWIDRQSIGTQRYAAQIVSAIRASKLVALMSSKNAFNSDQVIREVYIAGDSKKPFVIFQLDVTDFPDDVLYFVTGFPRIPVDYLNQQQLSSEIARLIATVPLEAGEKGVIIPPGRSELTGMI